MFKKSIYVVIIQGFGVLLGLFSIYFVVGDMAPEVYSLVGIHNIISGILITFSDLGIETVMMREALVWIKEDDTKQLQQHATQALISRIIGFCVLSPFLIAYTLYLSQKQYQGAYVDLLVVYLIGGCISALNNSMTLMVRARGGYVFSQIATTVNSYFAKFFGLALFFTFGSNAYLYFIGLAPIPLFIVLFIYTHKLYNFRYVHIVDTLKKIWAYKLWWIKTDIDYFKNSADSLLVSLVFPSAVMGSYTIYKTLENIARTFIEGFFDVLSQDSVKNKGNMEVLSKNEKKIKRARNLIIGVIILGTLVFSLNSRYFIELVNLKNYQYMDYLVYCVAAVSVIYLLGKYEINAIAFFGASSTNLWLSIAVGAISILAFLFVLLLPNIFGVILLKIVSYSAFSILAIVLFRKNRKDLYTKVLK